MRKNRILITIDYETWQPLPEGYSINWEEDIVNNTERLMDTFEQVGAKATFMVEMCELLWLYDKDCDVAKMIEHQIQNIVRRGHDVQLHIHPNWMPETGADCNDGKWFWNWDYASAEEYPFDYSELVERCKGKLEEIVRVVKPDYKVIAYRAGAYRVQPFGETYRALKNCGIMLDSSVFRGGQSLDRGYDFRACKSNNQPYYCNANDPQLEGLGQIIELPIATYKKGKRWFLDNDEALILGKRFLNFSSMMFSKEINYFTMIGHSKGKHDYDSLKKELMMVSGWPGTEFNTISEVYGEIIESAKADGDRKCTRSIHEVADLMNSVYQSFEPGECKDTDTEYDIMVNKKVLCAGYTLVLYTVLRKYGYNVKWITAFAQDMPKGRGDKKEDTHEVIELKMNGKKYIFDQMTNRIIPYSLNELLKKPELIADRIEVDQRYEQRNYYAYDSTFFYRRIVYYVSGRFAGTGYKGELFFDRAKRFLYNEVFYVISRKIVIKNKYRY